MNAKKNLRDYTITDDMNQKQCRAVLYEFITEHIGKIDPDVKPYLSTLLREYVRQNNAKLNKLLNECAEKNTQKNAALKGMRNFLESQGYKYGTSRGWYKPKK